MITIEDLFKHSVVISCMPSRIQLMKKSFAVANIPFPAAVVDAVRCGNTVAEKTKACRLSHGKAVEYAKAANWPYVLVLEDDAWPRANVRQKLEECLKTLPDNNIKIAALGYMKLRTTDTCKWRKAHMLTGAQSYIVFSSAFSSVIDAMNKSKHPADLVIGEFAKELLGFNTYAADTICFTQYNSPNEDRRKKRIDRAYGYYIYGAWRKDTKLKPWFWTAEHVEEEYARMTQAKNPAKDKQIQKQIKRLARQYRQK